MYTLVQGREKGDLRRINKQSNNFNNKCTDEITRAA